MQTQAEREKGDRFMSVEVASTIKCDKCGVEQPGPRSKTPSSVVSAARRVLKGQGWTRKNLGGIYADLCPVCSGFAARRCTFGGWDYIPGREPGGKETSG